MQEPIAKKPDLSPFAKALASQLVEEGPITVADYMAIAASQYYANENPFGRDGDFITAPEISQLFGEVIGAWLIDAWMQMGKPEHIQLIELGPGKGTLMADVMRVISQWPQMKSAVSLHLVETSAALRAKQDAALKAYRPVWYDSLDEVPLGPSLIVANEFFDALPVHQFEKVAGEWMERRVKYSETKDVFEFTHLPPEFEVTAIMPEEFVNAKEGSIFEVSPVSLSILETLATRIAEYGGAALIIDYGHAQPGLGDTVQAMKQHSYTGILANPGGDDITAHVDFGTMALAASQIVDVHGIATQGDFLNELGIAQRAEILRQNANEKQQWDMALAIKRLTAPSEMGALFKVMALTQKGSGIVPAGFVVHEEADDAQV